MSFKIVKGRRGGTNVLLNGYRYRKFRVIKNVTIPWCCNIKTFKAHLWTKDHRVDRSNNHNHNLSRLYNNYSLSVLKEYILQNITNSKRVYHYHLHSFYDFGLDISFKYYESFNIFTTELLFNFCKFVYFSAVVPNY